MGIFAKFNKEFAKWTTRTRPMGHVKVLINVVISTIGPPGHVDHVKTKSFSYRRKRKNESNLSEFS
ncbi:hypothetical protein LBR02_19110 [Levilactobacillus brevis]|nr:hypothetical protein LBR02_19110 [Levilactobacillus brevis]